ncbi:hypothetical protein NV379_13160 [Paenibacillus sp. N1-5-1-14]|uniref:hypothetical protein n=1 Tax=Paenibacillus radicibacter TaxID=2972488 RepID=UPI0021596345|nr:hypothetical protein [Paenibacillus radicibacter]MCR8643604.1 hypothetical protein [Paenibacillus radicibacter]
MLRITFWSILGNAKRSGNAIQLLRVARICAIKKRSSCNLGGNTVINRPYVYMT